MIFFYENENSLTRPFRRRKRYIPTMAQKGREGNVKVVRAVHARHERCPARGGNATQTNEESIL